MIVARQWLPAAGEQWRRRRTVWPLVVAGLLYLLGPTLSPVERVNDMLADQGPWLALFVVALVAFVVVALDDRRQRRRLRQVREEKLRVVLK